MVRRQGLSSGSLPFFLCFSVETEVRSVLLSPTRVIFAPFFTRQLHGDRGVAPGLEHSRSRSFGLNSAEAFGRTAPSRGPSPGESGILRGRGKAPGTS